MLLLRQLTKLPKQTWGRIENIAGIANITKMFDSSEMADTYLKYRPTYGPDVYDTITSFCKETGACDFSLALDVGCGSGQSTLPLTKHFQKVVGRDISEFQIARAPKHFPNLSYQCGPAEDLSFMEDGTVDLVTVAQSIHWMDTSKLYAEVERVLKPGGALVVYGYAGIAKLDEPQAEEITCLFRDVLGPYWAAEPRLHVEQHYRSYSLPFPGWRRNDSLTIEGSWTVDELVGYLCSWSPYYQYLMDHPNDTIIPAISERLKAVYRGGEGMEKERKVKMIWPVFMLMGHKPQS